MKQTTLNSLEVVPSNFLGPPAISIALKINITAIISHRDLAVFCSALFNERVNIANTRHRFIRQGKID